MSDNDKILAQKYIDLMNANHIVVKNNISRTELYQQMKQLYAENQSLKYDKVDLLNELRKYRQSDNNDEDCN